jgi:hypothetical protein
MGELSHPTTRQGDKMDKTTNTGISKVTERTQDEFVQIEGTAYGLRFVAAYKLDENDKLVTAPINQDDTLDLDNLGEPEPDDELDKIHHWVRIYLIDAKRYGS